MLAANHYSLNDTHMNAVCPQIPTWELQVNQTPLLLL